MRHRAWPVEKGTKKIPLFFFGGVGSECLCLGIRIYSGQCIWISMYKLIFRAAHLDIWGGRWRSSKSS